MRTAHTVAAVGLVAGIVLALAPAERPARAQDPFGGLRPNYWPQRRLGHPINPDALGALSPKPTHLQLYYSLNRGPFQKGPKVAVGALQPISEGKQGFVFDAPRDGDYEFAVPGGAFYLFPKAPRGTGTEFVTAAVERNLLVIPGGVFSRRDTHFRVSYAASDETLARGIEVLRALARGA